MVRNELAISIEISILRFHGVMLFYQICLYTALENKIQTSCTKCITTNVFFNVLVDVQGGS